MWRLLHAGPNIDYLRVCLRFWDEHLNGNKTDSAEEPKLRVYLQDAARPGECDVRPGKWLQTPGWPDSSVETRRFVLGAFELLNESQADDVTPTWQRVPFSMQCGQTHGEWLHFGFKGQSASDQRANDAFSFCSTTQPLTQELAILGFPSLRCSVRLNNSDRGLLAARLVDVWPDGSATLITHGLLNLTHRRGHDEESVQLLEPGKEYDVTVKLHSCAYVVPQGHQLRLSLSACYWPSAWPTHKAVEMEVRVGKQGEALSELLVPEASDVKDYSDELFNVSSPSIGPELPFKYLKDEENEMKNEHDFVNGTLTKTIVRDGGLRHFPSLNAAFQHRYVERYTCSLDSTSTPKSETSHENRFEYDDVMDDAGNSVQILVTSTSELTADEKNLMFEANVKAELNQEVVFEKKWKENIEKKFF